MIGKQYSPTGTNGNPEIERPASPCEVIERCLAVVSQCQDRARLNGRAIRISQQGKSTAATACGLNQWQTTCQKSKVRTDVGPRDETP